jgi:5-methylcytosine-specific restriction endonuclease McrA
MPQRIPTHRPLRLRSSRPQRDESGRPNAAARGYCDKAHKRWRQAVLVRDAWQCLGCGVVAQSAHADHIVPVSEGGARYDVANGQTLCRSCHGRKTRREQALRRAGSQVAVAAQPSPGRGVAVAATEGGQNPSVKAK